MEPSTLRGDYVASLVRLRHDQRKVHYINKALSGSVKYYCKYWSPRGFYLARIESSTRPSLRFGHDQNLLLLNASLEKLRKAHSSSFPAFSFVLDMVYRCFS